MYGKVSGLSPERSYITDVAVAGRSHYFIYGFISSYG